MDDLSYKTFQFIQSRQVANKSEIAIHLRSIQDVQETHIQSILGLLVYDDKIEEVPNELHPKNPNY